MSYEVVRLGLYGEEREVLGRYRWKLPALIHQSWSNIGLRVSVIRTVKS